MRNILQRIIDTEHTLQKHDHYVQYEHHAMHAYNVLTHGHRFRDTPSMPESIENICHRAKWNTDQQIELAILWGASKESKTGQADKADTDTLSLLSKLRSDIRSFPGNDYLNMSILFCDVHHALCNGIELDSIERYYASLEEMTQHYFTIKRLSEVLQSNIGYLQEWPNFGNKVATIKARALMKNTEYAAVCIAAMRKHSRFAQKYDADFHQYFAQLYLDTEIDFLYRYEHNDWRQEIKEFKPLSETSNTIFISLSNPQIQKPIAEAAGVPMLFFWPRKGHHGEVPWYRDGTK